MNQSDVSRRIFVGSMGVGAALTSLSRPVWAAKGPNDQVVMGMIGVGNQEAFQLSRRALRKRAMRREIEQHRVAGAADSHLQFGEGLQNCRASRLIGSDEFAHIIEFAESRPEIPGVRRRKPQVIEACVLEAIDADEECASQRGLLRNPLGRECGDR